MRLEHDSLSATRYKYDSTLSAVWLCYYTTIMLPACGMADGNKKNNNRRYWWSPINNFGQQRLNGAANWTAAKDGQVLPHFRQILSGALMPPCPIAAVF